MTVGDRTVRYEPATHFVMSVDLPAIGSIHPAATGEPYLAISMTLDPVIVAALIRDLPVALCNVLPGSGFSVAPVNVELLDAWIRMLRLIERPDDIALPDMALSRIGVAINWIRRHYTEQIRVEALADMAALSVSAFHRHLRCLMC